MKNDIIKLLNSAGIVYRINGKSSTIEIPFVEELPVKGKRCAAYFCPSNAGKGKKPWKIEIGGVAHVKWVATREEAEQLINVIESN
jgi:hypothetical protein